MPILDFSVLTDDQLVELIRGALQDAVRRGAAVEAAVRDAGLDEAEKARIARDAAEREARRLRDEEAARVAKEAADKVRRDAEHAKEQAAIGERAKIRGIAVRARELFGSDEAEFKVQVWDKAGDRRVYVGAGYDANWVEYYHTGNSRFAPATLKLPAPRVAKDLAAHLEISVDAAKAMISEFCAGLCKEWRSLKVEVTPDNAPLDPAAKQTHYILKGGLSHSRFKFGHKYAGREDWYCTDKDMADTFATEAEAMAAIPDYVGNHANHLAASADQVTVVPVVTRLAFPPKVEAT